jgi:hypothetical protein
MLAQEQAVNVSDYFSQIKMTDKELADKLAKIGYTTLWLDYVFLTIDYLAEQEQTFDNSDDGRYEIFLQMSTE